MRRSQLFVTGFIVAAMALPGASAWAASEKVIYQFVGGRKNGCTPAAPLLLGRNGDFYGTAESCGNRRGAVFRVTEAGKEKALFVFPGRGGALGDGLVQDRTGNLFGTDYGGANRKGEVFELPASGGFTSVYSFSGSQNTDARTNPIVTGLTMDAAGHLFGVTSTLAYRLSLPDHFKRLVGFPKSQRPYPVGTLALDGKGDVFGVTAEGGHAGLGMIYEVSSGGSETTIYSFTGQADGAHPLAGVILDAGGNLYGTTQASSQEGGTVYKVSPTGSMTILHRFPASTSGPDGNDPESALTMDAAGNLFGTTRFGGSGVGTVFEISSAGVESVLYSFAGGTGDGAFPLAGLTFDKSGNLWGTTSQGGAGNLGTVFMVAP